MEDGGGHQMAHIEYPGLPTDYVMEMVHRFYDEYYFRPKAAFRVVWKAIVNRDVPRLYVEAKVVPEASRAAQQGGQGRAQPDRPIPQPRSTPARSQTDCGSESDWVPHSSALFRHEWDTRKPAHSDSGASSRIRIAILSIWTETNKWLTKTLAAAIPDPGTGRPLRPSRRHLPLARNDPLPGHLLAHPVTLIAAVFTPWIAFGIALLIGFFASYLTALSWADLTFVLPATAFGNVIVALLARFWLHEPISLERWAGIVLITVGVGFVAQALAHRETRIAASSARPWPEKEALR